MLYILLIFFPITMAASCFVLRKHTHLVVSTAMVVVLTQLFLVIQLPLNEPVRLIGVTLALNELTRLFLYIFLGVGALSLLVTLTVPHGEHFVPVTLLIIAISTMILLLQDPFIVSLLLVWAGIVAVLAILDMPARAGMLVPIHIIAVALKYLILMVLAAVLIYLSFVLAEVYQIGELTGRGTLVRFVLALLIAGFALRLALIPFHTWLPDMVEHAAPMVSVLVIAIINTTSLIVLIFSFQRFPSLVIENPTGMLYLRIGGIVTSVFGALLSLNQTSIRRTVGYLLVYNSGMIFYGLVSVSVNGLTGALFETINQAFVVVLLFVSIGLLELPDGRAPGIQRRDLLRRWPVAGIAFIGSGVALLGLPPFSGFISKMLLFQTAIEYGWGELLPLVVSSACAGLAFAQLVQHYLLGPTEEKAVEPMMLPGDVDLDVPMERVLKPEPRGPALLLVMLLVVCLMIGLFPQPFLLIIDGAIRSLTFVRLGAIL